MKTRAGILLAMVVCAGTLSAQSPAPSVAAGAAPKGPRPPACVTPEFRQFDFWRGRWRVTNPNGLQIGTSEVVRVSEGCALREQWTAANGKGGTSINYYDPADKKWHQDWVGGDGTILHLQGGLQNGAMVLSGETQNADGAIVVNRITWTPLPEGKVRQNWEISSDEGVTWKSSFVGIYERAAGR